MLWELAPLSRYAANHYKATPLFMRELETQQIDALAAPKDDGAILVWPRDRSLVQLAAENRALRSTYDFPLGRHSARDFLRPEEQPFGFMTGHQPAFFHAGVWVKNAAVAHLAELSGGQAIFLAVDSDVPGRLAIDWPDDSGPYCRVGSAVVSSYREGQSYEQLSAATCGEVSLALGAVPDEIRPGHENAMAVFRSGFDQPISSGLCGCAEYVARWMNGVRGVEAALGLRGPECVGVSELFDGKTDRPMAGALRPAARAFLQHVAVNAGRFAAAYNTALASYRQRNGIRGIHHPIPDLIVEGDRVELPFWRLRPGGPRMRLFTFMGPDGDVRLQAEGDADSWPVNGDESALQSTGVRPRALAQTMFLRLFGCDLFVHGIGGAKYDTITDEIVRAFFGVEPPTFACVSATLRLPARSYGITSEQLAAARRAVRDVRYNVPRYLEKASYAPEVSALVGQRTNAILRSDRLRASRSRDREQRRGAYHEIRRANEELLRALPGLPATAFERLEEIDRRFESDRVALSREWFFGLHSLDSLRGLVEKLGGLLAPRR